MNKKGYCVANGYVGYIDKNKTMKFPTEKEYDEFMMDESKKEKEADDEDEEDGNACLYKTKGKDYIKNEIDLDILNKEIKKQGWKKESLYEMILPENHNIVRQICYDIGTKSISRKVLSGLEAALGCSVFYLSGKTKIKNTERYFFPYDENKKYRIKLNILKCLDDEQRKILAKSIGISTDLIKRTTEDKDFKLFFTKKLADRMFNNIRNNMEFIFSIETFDDLFLYNKEEKVFNNIISSDEIINVAEDEDDMEKYFGSNDDEDEDIVDNMCISTILDYIDGITEINTLDSIIKYIEGKKLVIQAKDQLI